jgi:protein ImuB
MVPTEPEERFESLLELEWPIEGLEPLSFVLTRLLEPLSIRLERRDRGVAVLHVMLGLVTRQTYARHLQLPSPVRDVRTLRTLALLDLDMHPPTAAIDRVMVAVDPTPGRVLQHTLFMRAHPTPEQLSTLLARLGALMGQDRIGAPMTVDSYRPGAFDMQRFATEHDIRRPLREKLRSTPDVVSHASALRRCRQPVPVRVALVDGRPLRLISDRRGFSGGAIAQVAGPWRTSGNWWSVSDFPQASATESRGEASARGGDGVPTRVEKRSARVAGEGQRHPLRDRREHDGASASGMRNHASKSWDRDEWDVVLNDNTVYRIFRDRATDAWFIDAVAD